MRCAECDASNPESAIFCGQCYSMFATVRPAVAEQAPDPAPPTAVPADLTGPTRASATAGRFTLVDGELTWRCAVCDTANGVARHACEVCGAKMDAEEPTREDLVDWDAAKRAEALVPGLGHLRSGHRGMGASRMGIVGLWLIGAFTLAAGGVSGLMTAAPLVVGMGIIWVTGPSDLEAARRDRTPMLDPRRFMYVVIGATVGVIVAGGLAIIL